MERRTETQQTLPTVRGNQTEALALVKKYQAEGQLVFVAEEDLKTQTMFLPVVTVLKISPEDFHDIPGGVKMPKSHHVNRMAEAAGVFVDHVDVERIKDYVWVGKAKGRKRMPDGVFRPGEAEYEYDASSRSEMDFIRYPDKYGSESSKKYHLLEMAKFGHQRASTGARLALIRYFTKCPTAFKPGEIHKAMIFSRVDINTDQLLSDPEMRQAAIKMATGSTEQLFGPQPTSNVPQITTAYDAAAVKGEEQSTNYEVHNGDQEKGKVEVPWEKEQKQKESEEGKKNKEMIEELRAARTKWEKELPKDAKELIDDVLKQDHPDKASVSALIDKMSDWEARYKALRGVRK